MGDDIPNPNERDRDEHRANKMRLMCQQYIEETVAYAFAGLLPGSVQEYIQPIDTLILFDPTTVASIRQDAKAMLDNHKHVIRENINANQITSPLLLDSGITLNDLTYGGRANMDTTTIDKPWIDYMRSINRQPLSDGDDGSMSDDDDSDSDVTTVPLTSSPSSSGPAGMVLTPSPSSSGTVRRDLMAASRSGSTTRRHDSFSVSGRSPGESKHENNIAESKGHINTDAAALTGVDYRSVMHDACDTTPEHCARSVYNRLLDTCTKVTLYAALDDNTRPCQHRSTLGPLNARTQSRVITAFAVIRRINPTETVQEDALERWMSDPIGRLIIANYIRYFMSPVPTSYMTRHEERTLGRTRTTVIASIQRFKMPTHPSTEAIDALNPRRIRPPFAICGRMV